jgi:hypothetical protein
MSGAACAIDIPPEIPRISVTKIVVTQYVTVFSFISLLHRIKCTVVGRYVEDSQRNPAVTRRKMLVN